MNSPEGQEFYGWLKIRIEEEKIKKIQEGKWLE